MWIHQSQVYMRTYLKVQHNQRNVLSVYFSNLNSIMSRQLWVSLFLFALLIAGTTASVGDRSRFYNECLLLCRNKNCSNGENSKKDITLSSSLLWSCDENCKYSCMWDTVQYFVNNGHSVPQFHGKWPFIRFIGFQEPASTIFSMVNFYAHLNMYWKFRKRIRTTHSMFYVWTYFSITCLCGWFWSTVFHARDTPFTEVMDYSCAFTMVLTLLYCMLLRITYKDVKLYTILTCGYLSILYTHVSYLWSGRINYDYNMKFNIIIGMLTFITTLSWCYYNWKKLPHVHTIGLFNILTVIVTLLEVADFPPILWVFDAHSLWHAATAPLTVLLYRFMISDCTYLLMQTDKYV